MKALTLKIMPSKWPLTFIGLLAASTVIGIAAGSRVTFQFRTFFYALILANGLIVAYLFILKNTVYGVLIYLYSLVFLNYYWRIVLPGQWPDLDLPRMVFVFIWMMFLTEVGFGVRRLLPRLRMELAMFAVVAVILISIATIGKIHLRQMLNGYAIPYAMFIVAKNVFRNKDDIKKFVYLFAIPLSFYFPVNLIFEHYRMTQFVFPRFILSPEVAGETVFWGGRTMGVFLQPSATGMAMVSMFVLSLYGLSKLRGAIPKMAALFITCVTPVAVFFSYTRSVYFGFFSAMMVLIVLSRRLKIWGILVILGIMLAILGNWQNVTSDKREAGGLATRGTVEGRLVLAEASLRMFADHPFIGVGFQNFREAALPYIRQIRTTLFGYRESWLGKDLGQHNHFLNLLTEVGLLGFVPFMIIYYYIVRFLRRAYALDSEMYDHDFVVVVIAVFAQWFSNAMSMEPRFYEFMNVLPFMLAGMIIGGYQRTMLHGWNNNAGERSIAREGTIR